MSKRQGEAAVAVGDWRRAGYRARGAAQLSRAARVPSGRRPRDPLARGAARGVHARARGQERLGVRSRQAALDERALPAPRERGTARRAGARRSCRPRCVRCRASELERWLEAGARQSRHAGRPAGRAGAVARRTGRRSRTTRARRSARRERASVCDGLAAALDALAEWSAESIKSAIQSLGSAPRGSRGASCSSRSAPR